MSTLTDRPRARLSYKQIRERLRKVKRQHARKARATRRRIEQVHQQLPKPIRAIFDPWQWSSNPGPPEAPMVE